MLIFIPVANHLQLFSFHFFSHIQRTNIKSTKIIAACFHLVFPLNCNQLVVFSFGFLRPVMYLLSKISIVLISIAAPHPNLRAKAAVSNQFTLVLIFFLQNQTYYPFFKIECSLFLQILGYRGQYFYAQLYQFQFLVFDGCFNFGQLNFQIGLHFVSI